jgi:transposase-like protein
MDHLTQVGTFCPNPDCPNYAKVEHSAVIRHGKTAQGVQRYRCQGCGKTFNQNKGTLFYRKQHPPEQIIETLALLAEGNRVSSLARAQGLHGETILHWLEQAAQHGEALEAVLLRDYRLTRGQIDGLWSYVGHKGEKNTIERPSTKASSGVRP